jgi:hypothetical protein
VRAFSSGKLIALLLRREARTHAGSRSKPEICSGEIPLTLFGSVGGSQVPGAAAQFPASAFARMDHTKNAPPS